MHIDVCRTAPSASLADGVGVARRGGSSRASRDEGRRRGGGGVRWRASLLAAATGVDSIATGVGAVERVRRSKK